MIRFDDFSCVDAHLRQIAADWVKKGDIALIAFANGKACDCSRLILEIRSAVSAAANRNHADRTDLRQIELIVRSHMRTVRAKQRIEAAVHEALDAGAKGDDLIDWVTDIYARVYTARAAQRLTGGSLLLPAPSWRENGLNGLSET